MSKQENNEEEVNNFQYEQDPVVYVHIPDEGLNGFLIREGAYMSTVQYFDNGVGYIVDMANDEFIIVDEIGIGYIDEEDEN